MKKKIEKYSAEYWREEDRKRREEDKLDREHYERRINSLLDFTKTTLEILKQEGKI